MKEDCKDHRSNHWRTCLMNGRLTMVPSTGTDASLGTSIRPCVHVMESQR